MEIKWYRVPVAGTLKAVLERGVVRRLSEEEIDPSCWNRSVRKEVRLALEAGYDPEFYATIELIDGRVIRDSESCLVLLPALRTGAEVYSSEWYRDVDTADELLEATLQRDSERRLHEGYLTTIKRQNEFRQPDGWVPCPVEDDDSCVDLQPCARYNVSAMRRDVTTVGREPEEIAGGKMFENFEIRHGRNAHKARTIPFGIYPQDEKSAEAADPDITALYVEYIPGHWAVVDGIDNAFAAWRKGRRAFRAVRVGFRESLSYIVSQQSLTWVLEIANQECPEALEVYNAKETNGPFDWSAPEAPAAL